MNIAFPLILIIVLVLPGILFNFFRQADPEFKIPLKLDNVQNEIAKGFFFSAFIHLSGILSHYLIQSIGIITVPDINYRTITVLLTGSLGEIESVEKTLGSIYSYPFEILTYFIFINIVGIVSGMLVFKTIRCRNLDHKFLFFRFDNPWFYLLSGEKAFFDEYIDSKGMDSKDFTKPDIFISIVIEQGSESYLYRGLLRDYYLNKYGGLDKIVLFNTYRRILTADKKSSGARESQKNEDESSTFFPFDWETSTENDKIFQADIENDPRYYKVEGDYFIVESSVIKNINVAYFIFDIDEVKPEEAKKIEDDEIIDIRFDEKGSLADVLGESQE